MVQITRGVILALVMLNPGAEAEIRAEQKVVAASGGWVKIPSTADGAATAFFVVDNPTMYDVYVVSVATDVAAVVEFREPEAKGSSSTRVVKEITAPAYGKVELTPAGVHVVLGKLKRPLEAGETIAFTLTTDSGAVLQVPAQVRP